MKTSGSHSTGKYSSAIIISPIIYFLISIGVSLQISVAPTDIEFFNSSNLGERYTNNIFVGDIVRGNLYFFEVNENRDRISLDTAQQQAGLSDLVVDSEDELSAITFGSGFGGITDIETGPDGNLYVLSFDDGIIYEISSGTATTQ